MSLPGPELHRTSVGGVVFWTDPGLGELGVVLGFSERFGGVSEAPFSALNLAAHVGDDPGRVDENRTRLFSAVGLGEHRDRLVVPDQVHGDRILVVGEDDAGSGAYASGGRAAPPQTDALICATPGLPLMLCFADCVPVVLVAPGPSVAVAHAGWRGALASIPGSTATRLASVAGRHPAEIRAYIGPHIHACHYAVSDEIMSQFCNTFGTVARADWGVWTSTP